MRQVTVAVLCVLLWMVSPWPSYAEELVSREAGLDVTFVSDCSGSMRTNDSKGIGREMVEAFVDTVYPGDIRIGYVAYNDTIVTSTAPVPISEQAQRQKLKELIGTVPYTGDTDIGLGLSHAYQLMPAEEGRKRVIVLISDGESDLGKHSERTLEQSNKDLNSCVEDCKANGIPVYTIAFGSYEGSKRVLEQIATDTGAKSFTAQSPEALIEVLYGLFSHNLPYQIQQFSSGIYAGGKQEIRCVFDELYLDEMDVLMISSGAIGDTAIMYGENQIPMTSLSHYAVGKIEGSQIDNSIKELTVNTSTAEGQSLKIFVIGYRKLVPVWNIDTSAPKNQDLQYQVYFKDRNGKQIRDEAFYRKFQWELLCTNPANSADYIQMPSADVSDGVIQGTVRISHSGEYSLTATLTDSLGSYPFNAGLSVNNVPPSGSLPEIRCNVLSQPLAYDLNQHFRDADGDALQFSLNQEGRVNAETELAGNLLTIRPEHSGTQAITLFVSDGEDTLAYPVNISVIPLWRAYWWVIVIICAVLAVILWKLYYKPKPELEVIAEKKKQNRFAGKLDAYFTVLPEGSEEIPPLTFPMHKLKESRVSLGELLREYPEASDGLELDQVFLIADGERRMVLYHSSKATIMLGSSIACRQLQYSVSFGDVVYITSRDGCYELELHYIAMIQ